ncbi:hypothetical protein [Coleofasciculus chthonoplastes]|uniref:hypothetical protein n=1 Tax=Coleofasciculus chthonoplastes TaxID=64178 RepID=UPI0033025F5A
MTSSFYPKLNRLVLTGTTTTVLATTSLTSFILTASRPAQANPEVDIYTLCTKFPLNSRCEGYEPPVSLKQRSGHLIFGVETLGFTDGRKRRDLLTSSSQKAKIKVVNDPPETKET